ncbi:MAG: hypothetical protein Q8P18_06725 [Pseudomonadota bacterium]|nr:hypothetical protein [Pseudomonadota bacterium]
MPSPRRFAWPLLPWILAAAACTDAPAPAGLECDNDALSTCLVPTQTEEYYVDQSLRYFDTLDASADRESAPTYSELVARWEWPPWLLLTGYGRDLTIAIDAGVLIGIPDTTVPVRECRAFDVQPFGRCRVSFDYEGRPCPIFEEFTFNDRGEMTFIEAWSDLPGLSPAEDPADPWAERDGVHRLSTRIPGLGNATGRIDPVGEAMTKAAATDPEVADFAARTQDFWGTWTEAYEAAGDDLFERGCGW